MAQRVITQLISDLSGVEIDEGDGKTVAFAFDGKNYTIDLTNKEADKFAKDLEKYTSVATRARAGSPGRRSSSSSSSNEDVSAIREWAKANGFEVSERGRISTEVREAYAAAN